MILQGISYHLNFNKGLKNSGWRKGYCTVAEELFRFRVSKQKGVGLISYTFLLED